MQRMTSEIHFPAYVIGLMSGTSADGVDAALLFTDGRGIARAHESLFVSYEDGLRTQILELMQGKGDEAAVAHALTLVHIQAVQALLKRAKMRADGVELIGFHGQTIRHAPAEGITVQIGDAALLAERTGIPVVADFRSNDVRHGGQGAPLVPLYHEALAASLAKPLMVVNIGGVANVTYINEGGLAPPSLMLTPAASGSASGLRTTTSTQQIVAFDCGPGNALMDDWVHKHTGRRFDENGALAASGQVDEAAVSEFLQHAFFAKLPPKSLDRNEFSDMISTLNKAWSTEDGAATLTAMTAAAIAHACTQVPVRPKQMILCGGGRHNPALVRMIRQYVSAQSAIPTNVIEIDALGGNGDMIEAEAFAYLAARSVLGLPLSLPTTTGVKEPMSGGELYLPREHHHFHDDDDDGDHTAPRTCCR